MFPMLSISVLFFIVTGIQFWYADYMKQALLIPENEVDTAFALITTTAPVLGCVVGGVLTSCFGGYQSPLAIMICFFEVFLAALTGFPLPWV